MEPEQIVRFAMGRLRGLTFDTLVVSCTNFRAFEAKLALEKTLGRKVVTSNSAVTDAIGKRLTSDVLKLTRSYEPSGPRHLAASSCPIKVCSGGFGLGHNSFTSHHVAAIGPHSREIKRLEFSPAEGLAHEHTT